MQPKIFFAILSLFVVAKISAQTCDTAAFQNEYWYPSAQETYGSKNVVDANGNIFILSDVVFDNEPGKSSHDALITKTNKRGTVLWAKRYGFSGIDNINDILGTADGGLICVGFSNSYNGSLDSEGWYFKIDANGNIVWSKSIGRSYSELLKAVRLKDGGYAILGYIFYGYKIDDYGNVTEATNSHAFLMKIDEQGKASWINEFYTIAEYEQPQNIICLNDGNIFYQGASFIHGPYHDWLSSLLKFSSADGSVIWQNESSMFTTGAKELPTGDIRTYFYFYEDAIGLQQIDKDGNLEWSKRVKLTVPFQDVRLIEHVSVSDDEDFFSGMLVSGKSLPPVLFKLKDTSSIEWAETYSTSNTHGYYLTSPFTNFYNDQFSISATLRYEDSYPYLAHIYSIQTDANGQTPCSQRFALKVSGTERGDASFTTLGFTFIRFGGKISEVGVYAVPVKSEQNVECFIATCCRDTVMHQSVQICPGQQYILPDGITVDSTSLYSSVLKKSSGCDSIIFTDLLVKEPLRVSLGGDTCFTSGPTIQYKLSFAPDIVNYLWQDGSADSAYTIYNPGIYSVKVSDNCSAASDTVIVFKNCDVPIAIPNAFTPNGDGLNDVFRIPDMRNQILLGFTIFNRWGTRIFFTTDPHKGWDGRINGTLQPTGNFIYQIVYRDIKKQVHFKKGNVLLIR